MKKNFKHKVIALTLTTLVFGLTGCGVKGPLYPPNTSTTSNLTTTTN